LGKRENGGGSDASILSGKKSRGVKHLGNLELMMFFDNYT
jgi:hypothetical protein